MPSFSIDTSEKRQSKTRSINLGNEVVTDTVYTENDILEPPLITYYAKVVDNLSNKDITEYKNAMDDDFTWYYGKVSHLSGESQYIVQFDIWNNEPAFNHRFYDKHCKNARNIKFGIGFYKEDLKKDNDYDGDNLATIPFLYARIYNEDYQSDWQPITMGRKIELISNTTNDKGILYGHSDHCIIQTKLILPNTTLDLDRYYFYTTIDYNFD